MAAGGTGEVTMESCVITGNEDGGIWGTNLTITNCTISGNSDGGIDGSNLHVNDCVITGNQGGGVRADSSSIIGCTISSNCAGREDGAGGLFGTDTEVIQTIMWGNTNTGNPQSDELNGTNLTLTCCDLDPSGVSGSITYLGPQVSSDPFFCAPEPCEAPPPGGIYTLRSDSPCLPQRSPCGLLIGALDQGCLASGIEDLVGNAVLGLMPGRPNPFVDETAIVFGLEKGAAVDLAIYDVSGRCVRRLASRTPYAAGVHQLIWKRSDDTGRLLPSGVYVCRLRAGEEITTSRLVVLR
jgi:hypothetical protein